MGLFLLHPPSVSPSPSQTPPLEHLRGVTSAHRTSLIPDPQVATAGMTFGDLWTQLPGVTEEEGKARETERVSKSHST